LCNLIHLPVDDQNCHHRRSPDVVPISALLKLPPMPPHTTICLCASFCPQVALPTLIDLLCVPPSITAGLHAPPGAKRGPHQHDWRRCRWCRQPTAAVSLAAAVSIRACIIRPLLRSDLVQRPTAQVHCLTVPQSVVVLVPYRLARLKLVRIACSCGGLVWSGIHHTLPLVVFCPL
jgi:hypothetical protein